MRFSRFLAPTLKEDPKEAEVLSHRLLVRAGFFRQHMSGVFVFLPLGWRVLQKVARIIREEMDRIGAQEVLMPSLTAGEVWKATGRWEAFGADMFRLKDRKGRDLALAPTHEELMTLLARNHFRSYRDLPQILYQIQTKFRDEPRPRGGVLRSREFAMKDSYSFDATWDGLDESYALHDQAYRRIFDRAGLKYVVVSASSGLMGGSQSEEFMVLSEAGEDRLVLCDACGYAANIEVAEGERNDRPVPSPFRAKEKVATPGVRSVEEVAGFLNVSPELIIKGLVVRTSTRMMMVLVRGDRDLAENKLQRALGEEVRLATPEEVLETFGVPIGFVGPVGAPPEVEIIADLSVQGVERGVVGGNEEDTHIVGVTPGVDFPVSRYLDLALVKEGDRCTRCGEELRFRSAIEVGHIFKLGTKYSEALGAFFTDAEGRERPIIMGSYGIGLARVMAAAVELYADEKGIRWPIPIAPFEAVVLDLDPGKYGETSRRLYGALQEKGVEVIWDDRTTSAGVKFKDADLIGYPFRLVVGERGMREGKVEIQSRFDGTSRKVPVEEAASSLAEWVDHERRHFAPD